MPAGELDDPALSPLPAMIARHLQLPLALLLALGVATGAAAQSASRHGDQTVLPVWNDTSGKFEAYLVLEPTEDAETGARFRFGNTSLDATFGLQACLLY